MTPQERLKIWRQEQQQGQTAAERRRIWNQERRQQAPPPAPQPEPPSIWEGIKTGAAQKFGSLVSGAEGVSNALGHAAVGDFGPMLNALERAGRGFTSAAGYLAAGAPVDPKIAQLEAQANAEQAQRPVGKFIQERNAVFNAEAARDQSLKGRIARGAGAFGVGALPYAAATVLGGGLPAMGGIAAFESADQPENLALNVGAATAIPVAAEGAGQFVAPILRRIRAGRGAAAEAAETAAVADRSVMRPSEIPNVSTAAQANPVVQRAMRQFEQEVVRIKTLPPKQQVAEMEAAIQNIGREASGIRPVSAETRAGYPPLMEFPENPNAIQQAGRLPFEAEGPPPLSAETGAPQFGVKAAAEPSYRETTGPSLAEMAMQSSAAKAKYTPVVSDAERAAMLEEFLNRPTETSSRIPQQVPVLGELPGPATEAERAALLESTVGKSKAAGQQGLFTGRVAAPAERTPLLQTISSFVKAGLLTRPTTHLRNLGSNLGFQVSEEVARIPGAIVDMMVSPFTRRRNFTGPNLGAIGRSAYEAATKGRQEAWRILRTGKTPTEIEGLQEIASGSKVVDTYVNGVFRLLKAEDAVFKSYALKRALEDRVRAAVLTQIRRGEIPRAQYAQQFKELMKYPPSDLANAAVLDAEVATFNNPNITGAIRKGVTSTLQRFGEKYPAAKPATQSVDFAIDRIIPFAKTPANVIARMLDYTPVGAGKAVTRAVVKRIIDKSFTGAEQYAFSRTFGRAAAGSGLLALGYVGYRDGWLTGLNEDDTSKRARDTATGRIPGAILIGKTWHQITGFSPLGNVIVIGATLAREAEQDQQRGKLGQAGTALKVAGQAALEQPLLAGTKQFIEGIEQPGSVGARVLGSTAGSAVPGIVSDIGQLADYGTQREAKTLGARVMERIPGVRQTLPVRQDVLGQPTQAANPFNPLRSTTAQQTTNPLSAELVRMDIGISGFGKKSGESDEDVRAKTENFGRLYIPYGIQLVSSPQYQRATDAIRQDAIKTLNSRAKELVEKGKERFARGPLSPAALVGAAKGSQARERAKKNAARK